MDDADIRGTVCLLGRWNSAVLNASIPRIKLLSVEVEEKKKGITPPKEWIILYCLGEGDKSLDYTRFVGRKLVVWDTRKLVLDLKETRDRLTAQQSGQRLVVCESFLEVLDGIVSFLPALDDKEPSPPEGEKVLQ